MIHVMLMRFSKQRCLVVGGFALCIGFILATAYPAAADRCARSFRVPEKNFDKRIEVDPATKATFPKEYKDVLLPTCGELELYRSRAYVKVFEMPDDATLGIGKAEAELAKANEELSELQPDAGEISTTVIANMVATIGLATCMETFGIGCVAAATGWVLAKVDLVNSFSQGRQAAIDELKKKVEAARAKLAEKEAYANGLNETKAGLQSMCQIVEAQCLE